MHRSHFEVRKQNKKSSHTSPHDVKLIKQAGGAPVKDHRRAAVVPSRCTDARLIETGLPRPVLLWIHASVGGIFARGSSWLLWLSLRLGLRRRSGSGVGVSLWLAVLRRTDVGLSVLTGFLYCAVGGSTCSCSDLGFGMQTSNFSSGFLAVVLLRTVTLWALFALAVGTVVVGDVGQVSVLGPHSRRKRMEAELGLAALAALL